ncbi:MAG: molybdenum cofactor biosynthesis protein A [Gammaproteobacteria bacterium BRH_c0]|nr:MAG: molybdenum cofactor biosynthesis protein A [Gammaproteobacteria bacterium BRH_c0]
MTSHNNHNVSAASLTDPFGRHINYLRLSVTDRCNLRCTYCMAEHMTFLPRQQILGLEEMTNIATAFTELGVSKIRLTGGEPLARQGVMTLVENLGQLPGLKELVMTTNGVLLPQYAQGLKDAGVRRLNISIDSLDQSRFREMTRIGDLSQVLAGIEAARQAGFENIKLNVVVLAGVNDHEVEDLARFAIDRGMDISFIEEMPLGHIDSHQRADTQFFSDRILDTLSRAWTLVPSTESTGGPSRYHRVQGTESKIGFISPMSNNFCASCNRVRLTVEGKLLLCLGNEHDLDLKALVRRFPGEADRLKDAIIGAIGRKPEKHHFDPDRVDIVRFMNATGG